VRRRHRATGITASALLALALLASCGEEAVEPGAAPPAADTARIDIALPDTARAHTALADTALQGADSLLADTAAWTAGIIDVQRPAAGAVTLVGVRAASHAGYDRVVFEFAGADRPWIHVEYVDRPVRDCGAGEVVPLAGDAWLLVRFYPMNAHDESGQATAGPREHAFRLPIVLEAKRTCDFEAVVEYVMGVTSPNRYRVIELTGPPRVVVDVRHGR